MERNEGEGRERSGGAKQRYIIMMEEETMIVAVQWRIERTMTAMRVARKQQQVRETSMWIREQFGALEQSAVRPELVGVEAEMQCTRYKRIW